MSTLDAALRYPFELPYAFSRICAVLLRYAGVSSFLSFPIFFILLVRYFFYTAVQFFYWP